MNERSPRWAPIIALVTVAMLVAALSSAALALGAGWALWGSGGQGSASSSSDGSSAGTDSGSSGGANANAPVGDGGDVAEDSWASTAAVISPSTVSIQVTTSAGGAEGSGVVYSADGQILTNAHVVSGGTAIAVTLADGRSYAASVKGADASTDLALLELTDPPSDLVAATFANSDDLRVGQDVMAMGTPLGFANTATTGIVSALNRPVVTREEGAEMTDASFSSAIQTDASVNPGNSGGPLVNRAGHVVGINSSIASNATSSEGAGSIGLGFAIPSNTARLIADQLAQTGTATHALLGVRANDGEATLGSVSYRGAQILEVTDGSAAAKAGLEPGDVVTRFGDVPIGSATALTAYVRSLEVGSTHTLTVYRDGQERQVEVTLGGQ